MLQEFTGSWVYFAACLFVGACIGSFLNVVIYRLPRMLEQNWQREAAQVRGETVPEFQKINLATPRSNCPHCGRLISAADNIPVLSFLLLGGRCRHCKIKISSRYPFVEILTAVLTSLVAFKYGATYYAIGAMFFTWTLIALAFIDLDTQLLPDDITLPLLWAAIIFNLHSKTVPLEDAILGAAIGYLSLWSIYWAFKLIMKKEGMGYGDFKLLAGIGAFFGWKSLLTVILLSSILGSIVGVYMVLFRKHSRESPIPFGPFLATAGIAGLFINIL